MRFGLFGTGPWAHLAHAPALAAHPEVEFTGVWGRDSGKAGELADKFGTRAYSDIDSLIADVDAVAIALPPDVQAPLALRAAEAGRHLVLDKPVALRTEDAEAVAAAVAARKLASVVFFTRRFTPELDAFVTEAAATGGWTEARVDHLGSIFTPDNPFGASPWRRERGGLWDVGPHALALVVPVLGPVTEVAAMAGPRDITHLVLRHAGGAISRLTLAVDAPEASAREEAVFAGEAGLLTVPRARWSPDEALGRAVDQLLAAAAGGASPACDVRFGADVTAVLVAAETALRDGVTVKLG
ncbi:putative dehydrogenase [Actinoplanes lutulentus]|uniref:Putative dehydrogenase n=1 Tax=Actinoplanes lutulentus TaxID=1287878 RepID=A0A327Z6V7_9ACTN|nr:Gfo/Idh/MocA family oxidoreductase [Actinoplanes lutulentus]MBB2946240.1 putative dehydrogenase [Actinoplanes lutulentus]RAK32928.1 putative dehydrogenase [Actinoplanes lutulentus]